MVKTTDILLVGGLLVVGFFVWKGVTETQQDISRFLGDPFGLGNINPQPMFQTNPLGWNPLDFLFSPPWSVTSDQTGNSSKFGNPLDSTVSGLVGSFAGPLPPVPFGPLNVVISNLNRQSELSRQLFNQTADSNMDTTPKPWENPLWASVRRLIPF